MTKTSFKELPYGAKFIRVCDSEFKTANLYTKIVDGDSFALVKLPRSCSEGHFPEAKVNVIFHTMFMFVNADELVIQIKGA